MTRYATVAALGTAQTLAWASTYYLPAIVAAPMARDLDVSVPTVFAAFSVALFVSAFLGPHSGRAIDRWGGRPVLVATNVVFAVGLALLGAAQSTAMLFFAWAVIGVGMGSGLYEAAFAALVRLYGAASRSPITGITLFAGFASTVGWPLTAWVETQFGWREACYLWAGLHLVLGLPLNWSLPDATAAATPTAEDAPATSRSAEVPLRSAVLLSFIFAATWFISTAMAAHLPRLLQASGATLTAAVAVGALIGPAQVAARLLEFGLLRKVHPLLSARLAAAMHPVGVGVLALFGAPAAAVFGVLHGAGNGILTIAKGTLPLVLFGPPGVWTPARRAHGARTHRPGTCAVAVRSGTGRLGRWSLDALQRHWTRCFRGASTAFDAHAATGALVGLRPSSQGRPLHAG